ncbi:LegC family aminotransferase [Campylobacter sp. MIT 97-5078]|uniref:LegC family aminotransferase n=1 Tax=Campylobacter sp. MIT 97-5078 TaxID=1548153 RepID=UPI00051417BF|nr:LegC family aminotransferase [Campylobacter sp. MIT 97-5078]KGI55914.1 aminotransferase DegT [Campylobacter sp. MIT 97-5078]TQR27643.1 LegC family aminotransferase [Campylobacter sp. MIT 97-5078]
MFKTELNFIKSLFAPQEQIPLHEPRFIGNEQNYLNECLKSGFVSSVGEFVNKFEKTLAQKTKSKFVVAMNSGTSALHIALLVNGVKANHEVITQSLSFVATANAIAYTGAKPIFIDIDEKSLSLSPKALRAFLKKTAFIKDKKCFNKSTKKRIKACIVMHSFGLSAKIIELKQICEDFHIALIEDAAEAVGSLYKNKALGTFAKAGIYSFNGNKIITGGCGGVLLSDDEKLALKARHLSTTAKIAHAYEYKHDKVGYNYRLCNINAALLLAQLEKLGEFVENKRSLAKQYKAFFKDNKNFSFVDESKDEKSNFWLNTLIAKDENTRTAFIEQAHKEKIYLRPAWQGLHSLKMYKNCQRDELKNTLKFISRIVNLPSSVRLKD